MSEILITLRNITKRYVDNAPLILNGINLDIHRKDFIALMGASGSGKTTLMNIIGLLDVPTSGEYYFDGKNVAGLDDNSLSLLRNRHVGFVFQSFYLIPYLSVLDNVLLPRFYSGGSMSEGKDRAVLLLDKFGMGDKLKSKPSQLSGGQQQRAAIARALINDPELILADEPTGQLDSSTSETIMDYISTLPSLGCTVLLVTHDPYTAGFAKKRITIKDGIIEV